MIILSFLDWKLMDIVVHNHWLMLTPNISIKGPGFLLVNTSSTIVMFDFICLQAREESKSSNVSNVFVSVIDESDVVTPSRLLVCGITLH